MGKEILANIAMFVPFGFFLSSMSGRKGLLLSALLGAAFSLAIEALQLVLMRGLFEWDDLINNATGAVLGWALYALIQRTATEKNARAIEAATGVLFAAVCVGVFITGGGANREAADITSKLFCFQIDEAAMDGRAVSLTGFAFCYEQEQSKPSVILRSTRTNRRVKLDTEYGLDRSDVNDYFSCEYDYAHTGFAATGEADPDEEYEVMVRWPWSIPVSTGAFLTGSEIHWFPQDGFAAPELNDPFVMEGTPRVYRPDFHCWVYQYRNALYWIADEDFFFEEDGTTYIQYQMWTTQIQNLPAKRLEHNHFWDNIGGCFEDYELPGDFGPYRVMKRDLPSAYSLTSIETGYYKNGEWIWRNYFRPVYDFTD